MLNADRVQQDSSGHLKGGCNSTVMNKIFSCNCCYKQVTAVWQLLMLASLALVCQQLVAHQANMQAQAVEFIGIGQWHIHLAHIFFQLVEFL